jgi:hypothetical protein
MLFLNWKTLGDGTMQRRWNGQRRQFVQVTRKPQEKPREIVLVATSVQEYDKLRRDYPNKTIVLDVPYEQVSLFNTREFLDA